MAGNKPEAIVDSRTLRIGIGTTLQFQMGEKSWQFKATAVLVGMVPGEYLIIRVPPVPGILNRLSNGDPVIVRYLFEGNLYGFNSSILTHIYKPALIMFLCYPEVVETLNLRKAQRVQCCFPVMLKKDGQEFKAVILDISLGGSRVGLDMDGINSLSFEIDQTICLSFHLSGIAAQEQVINGTVKNFRKDEQHCEMGIQFDRENEVVLNNIKDFLDDLTILSHE